MKALILAAGRGRRFGVVSEGLNKCMLEVSGKPLIEYSLHCAAQLNRIEQIVAVVGYRADEIMDRYGNAYEGKEIAYVRQDQQEGLVQAIECAHQALGKSDFMLMLGDEFMLGARHQEFISEFEKRSSFALCGAVRVMDKSLIKKTYAMITLEDGRIARLIEKPNNPVFNDMMGTGNCVFNNGVFDYIPKTPINQNRKEKELPDLIQCLIDDGQIVRPFVICNEYVNVNNPDEFDKTRSYFAHL